MPRLPKLPKPRKRQRKSDDAYNARRRFERRGDRLMKQAEKETGTAAERLRAQAESNYANAARLYEDESALARFRAKHDLPEVEIATGEEREFLQRASEYTKESMLDDSAIRSELEARELLRGPVGRRIYSATRDLWYDESRKVQDPSTFDQKIMDAMGVNSMSEVIDKFEKEMGEDLYKTDDIESNRPSDSPRGVLATKFARLFKANARR